jgi:hypothetical protein
MIFLKNREYRYLFSVYGLKKIWFVKTNIRYGLIYININEINKGVKWRNEISLIMERGVMKTVFRK